MESSSVLKLHSPSCRVIFLALITTLFYLQIFSYTSSLSVYSIYSTIFWVKHLPFLGIPHFPFFCMQPFSRILQLPASIWKGRSKWLLHGRQGSAESNFPGTNIFLFLGLHLCFERAHPPGVCKCPYSVLKFYWKILFISISKDLNKSHYSAPGKGKAIIWGQ